MYGEHFSEPEILKKEFKCNTGTHYYGGPLVMVDGENTYTDDTESMVGYCGVTGSGKTRRGMIPLLKNIIKAKESFIATDSKKELYDETKDLAAQTHKCIKVDFQDLIGSGTDQSATYNPMLYPYKLFQSLDPNDRMLASDLIDDMSYGLYNAVDDKNSKDFWMNSAKTAFMGACFALMYTANPPEVNIFSVFDMFVKGEEKYSGSSTYLKEFTEMLPEECDALRCLYEYVNICAPETRSGVRAELLEGLSMFMRNEGLKGFLSTTPYDLNIDKLDNAEKPIALYICIPDETPIYYRLAGILCNQLIMHFIRLAHRKYHGKLKNRLHLVLEELGNIGPSLPKLPFLMSAARSRNIRVEYVVQAFSQLEEIYGKTGAETIRSNTDITILYRTSSWSTLQEFSYRLGNKSIRRRRVNVDIYESVPLLTPTQIGAFRTGQALIMIRGRYKYVTQFPDFEDIPCYKRNLYQKSVGDSGDVDDVYNPVSSPYRTNKNLKYYKTFQLKEYVKRKKIQKRKEIERKMMEEGIDDRGNAHLPYVLRDANRVLESEWWDENEGLYPRYKPGPNDVEDLVRRIDKKIAELEKEEREKTEETRGGKEKDEKKNSDNVGTERKKTDRKKTDDEE